MRYEVKLNVRTTPHQYKLARIRTTGANACQHSRTDHKVRVLTRGLESAADKSEQGTDQQAIDTANPICKPPAGEAAEDCT